MRESPNGKVQRVAHSSAQHDQIGNQLPLFHLELPSVTISTFTGEPLYETELQSDRNWALGR